MEHRFYAIQTTAGHENKVRSLIQRKIEADPRPPEERALRQALVPTQEVVEIKNGKKVTVERKIFPGYVLVEMVMDEQSWHVVRNTPGVTGFVGIGNKPTPLPQSEADTILKQMQTAAPTKFKVTLQAGQAVKIIDGPFEGFEGIIETVNQEKGKVRVRVSFFGRETPVELDFLQVERLV
jgi:transcription termination/antitermination protein NusG